MDTDDFHLTNIADEFWSTCNSVDLDMKPLSLVQKESAESFTDFTEFAKTSNASENVFADSIFTTLSNEPSGNPERIFGISTSLISEAFKPNGPRDLKAEVCINDIWSSPLDFEQLLFADENDRNMRRLMPHKLDFEMNDFNLDSFSLSTDEEQVKEERSDISAKSNSMVQSNFKDEVKTSKTKKSTKTESEDDEDWDESNPLASYLKEPKINEKVMQKIKGKSLIGLRRVKYAVKTANSSSLSKRSCSSETICFATKPAVKAINKKYPRKNVNKLPVCKENSLKGKSSKLFNEKRKNASSHSISSEAMKPSDCKTGSSPLFSAHESIYPFVSAVKNSVKQCSVSTPWPNMLPLSNDLSRNADKLTNQSHLPCHPAPKFHKELPFQKTNRADFHFSNKIVKMGNNNLINLKNVVKIEIYTKPPKKMVITKGNTKELGMSSLESVQTSYSSSIEQPALGVTKLTDILKRTLEGFSDDLIKKISLPFGAVNRSYLTTSEMSCIKRQVQLLQLLKELKNAPHYCKASMCDICKDVSMMEKELRMLQQWSSNGSDLIKRNLEQGNDSLIFVDTTTLESSVLKSARSLSKLQNQSLQEFSSSQSYTEKAPVNVKKAEDLHDGLTLYISDLDLEASVPKWSRECQSSAEGLGKSQQWAKATQYKNASVLTSRFFASKRKVNLSNECVCQDNCRSFLTCSCASEVAVCVRCNCFACENPFFAFHSFSVDLQAIKADSCLMQSVYDVGLRELLSLLNQDHHAPCCQGRLKLFQIVPNIAACPFCGSFLSFSWCDKTVKDENVHRRNHCTICGSCQRSLRSHCYVCGRCTLSCLIGKCLVCREEKVFSGVAFN